MKLIISAADYAMTESITDGCIRAIRDGLLMDVGIMTNNYKYAKRGAEELKKYPHVSVGMDINLVSGVPATDPALIPSLVDENGIFITSVVRNGRKRAGETVQITYEDAYLEAENQIKRFIDLFGRTPVYMNGHSYSDENSNRAITDLCRKYDIPWCEVFEKTLNIRRPKDMWYKVPEVNGVADKMAFASADIQKSVDVVDFIIRDKCQILDNDYTLFRLHVGYADAELYQMSTFHDIRSIETSALCDLRFKKWVEENKVEVINYAQFFKENPFRWDEIPEDFKA